MTTYAHDISPDVLEDGQWVLDPRTRIMQWIAAPPKPVNPDTLLACPRCRATTIEWCRSRTGRAVADHAERLVPRSCECGTPVVGRRIYCQPCQIKTRRKTTREANRRMRSGNKQLWEAIDAMYGEAS